MKKGQVTVFIIIGIIILLIIGLALYFYSSAEDEIKADMSRFQTGSVQEQVSEHIRSCFSDAVERGAYTIGLHGGYITPAGQPEYSEPGDGVPVKAHYFAEQVIIPHALDSETVLLRPKNEMVAVFENFVIVEFEKCADFSPFIDAGFQITRPNIPWEAIGFDFDKAVVPHSSKKVNSSITLADDFVLAELTYPLILKREEEEFFLDDFSVKVPLRLGLLYDFASRLVNDASVNQPYNIIEHCDTFRVPDESINIYFVPNNYRKNYVIRFVDAQPVQRGDLPLRFQFAVKNAEVSGQCGG